MVGGHKQDRSIYNVLSELSSSTLRNESIMILLAIALKENYRIISADIVGAYLNAKMKRDIYMKINRFETNILCQLNNDYKKFVNKDDNCIYVKLIKALYGCIESAKLFYELLRDTLVSKFIHWTNVSFYMKITKTKYS